MYPFFCPLVYFVPNFFQRIFTFNIRLYIYFSLVFAYYPVFKVDTRDSDIEPK